MVKLTLADHYLRNITQAQGSGRRAQGATDKGQ
jgi:hypothetical protein